VTGEGNRFGGKVALITGGSKGIGRAIAHRLAAEGAHVAITWLRDRVSAEKTVTEIEELGARALAVRSYLKEPNQPRELLSTVRRELGEPSLLVSNAATGVFGSVLDLKKSHWDLTMETNAAAFLRLVQASRGLEAVVALTSMGSIRALPGYGSIGVSKAALEALVRYVAVELAPGAHVNALSPGLVLTESTRRLGDLELEMAGRATPMGRLVTLEEIAAVAAFLLSKEAAMITGQSIVVDGGYGITAGVSPAVGP
jgi:enoyl-[acyl-carrier protein] reductase III